MKQQLSLLISEKLGEIENLEAAMDENSQILQDWEAQKTKNASDKDWIQSMLLNIQSSKKKDIIELQIAMRKLKLEKTDLHMQNLEIKRQILLSRNDQESKDEEMRALLSEVQRMREEMQMKEDQLAQSKEELRRKDAYISKI